MIKLFLLRRLLLIFGVFALSFSIFFALHSTPTVHSDDPAGAVIESNDPLVTQQGTWTSQAASSASGGSYLYSSGSESDALLLPFEGTRIEILYVKNPSLGDFAIEIDNTIRRTVVTTDDETSFGNSAVIDYLDNGPHVVKIFATDGVIAIDAFIGTAYNVSRPEINNSDPYGNFGPQRVGEIEQSSQEFSFVAESDSFVQTIHEPGSTYIKVHFAEMNLADGETVTVSSPDGTQVHTYPGSGFTTDSDPGFWALSIIGDTAIIEIHGRIANANVVAGNVSIDKYARGYSEAELSSDVASTESTCGSNQRTDVVCYEGSHPTEFNNSNAVAKLIISGVGSCTAWRISPGNYLLTNEHCISNQTHVNGTEVWFNYQRNVCGSGAANTPTIVTGNTFLVDNFDLDFALFTVNNFANISSYGYLEPDVRTATLGEEIYIPQHGDGDPKQFGIESDLNTGNVCRVDAAITAGYGSQTDTGYLCDTIGGSSGSPVLARSSHRVVALHHFGITTASCTTSSAGGMNRGTRIDLIWPFITNYFNDYKPTPPSLTAPTGTIEDATPTYSWTAQANAQWYQLYVNGPSGNVINTWYTASAVGCSAGTGTCSITHATTLAVGAHQWWVNAWSPYASAWSSQGNFTLAIDLPGEISRISPTGDVSTNPPTFSWTADPDATWYQLYVNGPSGTAIINEWYSAATAGCPGGTETCSVTPSVTEQNGAHKWWMRGYGAGGYGPWNPTATNFTQTNGPTLPVEIVATSPSGDTADNTPTYTWNADPWAEWYHIYVGKGSTEIINAWYSRTAAGCPAGTGTCSVTPSTVLARGNHTWRIQGWNNLGYGPWNAGLNFNVTVGAPATPVTTIAPTGTISTRTPTFSWNASSEATQYRLFLNNSSGTLLNQVITAAAAGCGAGTGPCSYTPGSPILAKEGSYNWWVQTLNTYGDGPWSTKTVFNLKLPVPGAVTLVSPTGSISENPPTYTWNATTNATWYYLLVRNNVGTDVVAQWYSATAAGCPYGTGTCSVTSSTALNSLVEHNWWIQSYSTSGTAWSSPLPFTLGFDSQFNGSATGWVSHTGTWLIDTNYLYTNPSTTDISSASNTTTYKNLDYQARIMRTGCDGCANMIIVRGTPGTASTNPGNNWDSGYRFQITRNGFYSVFRLDSASGVQLQGWTTTAAVNQGDAWNTLRVVANGNSFSFYINGTLVWAGTDSTYSTGRVGVGMYRTETDTNDEITVDWATLTVPAAAAESTQTSVSTEQQALNEAANRNEGRSNPNLSPSTGISPQTESNSAPVTPPSSRNGTELPRE